MVRNKLTISDVCDELGLGPWTLRRLESLGRIPTPRRDGISGRRVYDHADIEQLRTALQHITDERTLAARERIPA